jgi:peptidoglycan hydrolase-like protein with peptidoglycan-binding domain
VTFDETKHARGKGAQGGQFVSKGTSSEADTVGYDAKAGTGAGYGAKGGDKRVKQLQTLLNHLGMKDASGNPLKVDGKLGPRTTAAIKRLQRRLGLPADGKVSPALLKRIRAVAHPHKATAHKAGTHKATSHTAHPHKATPHKATPHKATAHKAAPAKAAPKPAHHSAHHTMPKPRAAHKPAAHHSTHHAALQPAPKPPRRPDVLTHDQRVSAAMLQRI